MKHLFYFFLFILFSCIFFSCAFNRMFLVPEKFKSSDTTLIQVSRKTGDTSRIIFSGNDHKPLFLNAAKDTVKFDFTIESVAFKSSSGNQLHGWWLSPKKEYNGITLLHCHGNAANLVWQIGAITPLVAKGYRVFMFDYSGFGYSEGKATRKNVLKDGNSALDFVLADARMKDKSKLLLYGQSLGGHLSAVLAGKRSKDIDGVIVEGAFSSHQDIAAATVKKIILLGFIGRIGVREMYSAKRNIRNCKKPVLVIPFYMGKKIFKNAGVPKEFYEIKKCHICGPSYYADSISIKIKAMVGIK